MPLGALKPSNSFTDCTSIVLMQELELSDVLTTDHHFVEAGLRPLLPVG